MNKEPNKDPNKEPKIYPSRQDLSKHFGVCKGTLKRWEKKGILTPVRFNSRVVRYRWEDIVKLEADARSRPAVVQQPPPLSQRGIV